MKEDIIEAFRKYLREEREAAVEQLARGMVDDFPSYKYVCGTIAAMDAFLITVNRIAVKLEDDGE